MPSSVIFIMIALVRIPFIKKFLIFRTQLHDFGNEKNCFAEKRKLVAFCRRTQKKIASHRYAEPREKNFRFAFAERFRAKLKSLVWTEFV